MPPADGGVCAAGEVVGRIPARPTREPRSGAKRRAVMILTKPADMGVDRFVEEQMFEEDLRAVMLMLRPHRNERLAGWQEYRTGGAQFRATVSWDPEFAGEAGDDGLAIPKMADVLEAILVGS